MKKTLAIWISFFLFATGKSLAQSVATEMPKLAGHNGRYELMVDGKPFFMLGGQVHNSSAWPAMLPRVWMAVRKMQVNTVEIPVYWEQIEPRQGEFDFSLVDTLLAQARTEQVRLVLLWFATWKNGSDHYMPEWMKKEPEKYPNITGQNGKPVDSPSPHADATLQADKKAFSSLMSHLKKADPQHTVIMMQVENESGSWGSVRDYSSVAQKLIDAPVPVQLLKSGLMASLHPVSLSGGSWKQVFGENADEYFHAWSVARFIEEVAAAGKAEYGLPMYVNAALREPFNNPRPNTYESGGPTDNVIPIWKAAAPHIDLVAPDIYLTGSEKVTKVLELYRRDDNPLFVPEAALIPVNAGILYQVLAMGGIGFSPFGMDDNGRDMPEAALEQELAPFAREYAIARPMGDELAQWAYQGKIMAAVERDDHAPQTLDLGAWNALVSFGRAERNIIQPNASPIGRLLFIKLDPNTFLLTGSLCHVSFQPNGPDSGKVWQYLKVEEGFYENGSFHLLRIRNGDETDWGGPRFDAKPTMLRLSLSLR